MHDVMTVQKHTEDHLVCGTRVHERVAGLLMVMAVSPLAIVLWQILATGASCAILPFLLVCLVLLYGLHLLLSSRRFTFEPHSKTCTASIKVFGVFRRQRHIEFCEVAVRRRFDLQLLRWLYLLVLVGRSEMGQRTFTMGYAADRAEALAHTIAELADVMVVDFGGRPLVAADGRQEAADGVVDSPPKD